MRVRVCVFEQKPPLLTGILSFSGLTSPYVWKLTYYIEFVQYSCSRFPALNEIPMLKFQPIKPAVFQPTYICFLTT